MARSKDAKQPYARCAAFTQSSGTGKSRMNDELAKSIFYIPMNLRDGPGSGMSATGFITVR